MNAFIIVVRKNFCVLTGIPVDGCCICLTRHSIFNWKIKKHAFANVMLEEKRPFNTCNIPVYMRTNEDYWTFCCYSCVRDPFVTRIHTIYAIALL